jgi:hypothetical protein
MSDGPVSARNRSSYEEPGRRRAAGKAEERPEVKHGEEAHGEEEQCR